MNDSFLEDLELLPAESQQGISSQLNKYGNKNVTTRDGMPLTNTNNLLENDSKLRRKKTSPSSFKRTETKLVQKDSKKYTEKERDTKKQDSKEIQKNKSDKREKLTDIRLKVNQDPENKSRLEIKEKENRDKSKTKVSDTGTKVIETRTSIKEHSQRSGSFKENHTLDSLSKENSRSSEPSIESSCNIPVKEKKRLSEGSNRNCETKDKDPVALLNAIKDLISTYTKQESTRILRAMQDLHVNSQANLIKNLLCQTDELINEMHPSKNSVRLKSLLEENRRLREDMTILEIRNSDLQKKLEELELLKQENSYLKLKYNELSNS